MPPEGGFDECSSLPRTGWILCCILALIAPATPAAAEADLTEARDRSIGLKTRMDAADRAKQAAEKADLDAQKKIQETELRTAVQDAEKRVLER